MMSPFQAAHTGFGAGVTATITRYMLDGTRCGMVQGRHAAWNWAYRVIVGDKDIDMGRGLVTARKMAASYADRIVESWPGGETFLRGPNGGLTKAP